MAAASSSSSAAYAVAGGWGSVHAAQGAQFHVRGGWNNTTGTTYARGSPVANLATMTWLDVVKEHLQRHPEDRHGVWYVQEKLIVGIDIPLTEMLSVQVRAGERVEIWIPGPLDTRKPRDTHEQIQYALAAQRCGRQWPPWARTERDPFDFGWLGGWDEKRVGRGPTEVEPSQDNSIGNLVGVRGARGRIVYGNIHALRKALTGLLEQLDAEVSPLVLVDIERDPFLFEPLGWVVKKYKKLSAVHFLATVLEKVTGGLGMASAEDRLIQSYTHVLPLVDMANVARVFERETGLTKPAKNVDEVPFKNQPSELFVEPDTFYEVADCTFGRALATVEIEYDAVELNTVGEKRRRVDEDDFKAARAIASDMLDDFLLEDWGDEDGGQSSLSDEFIAEVRELANGNKANADCLETFVRAKYSAGSKVDPVEAYRAIYRDTPDAASRNWTYELKKRFAEASFPPALHALQRRVADLEREFPTVVDDSDDEDATSARLKKRKVAMDAVILGTGGRVRPLHRRRH